MSCSLIVLLGRGRLSWMMSVYDAMHDRGRRSIDGVATSKGIWAGDLLVEIYDLEQRGVLQTSALRAPAEPFPEASMRLHRVGADGCPRAPAARPRKNSRSSD